MRIEVLTFERCPHASRSEALVREVVGALAPDAEVTSVRVETDEQARRLGFLGSPSVRVDGVDLEGRVAQGPASLACRFYEDGGTRSGVPPRWLVEAAVLGALRPRGVLFLCVANSARSQLAEGLARAIASADTRFFSAGSAPSRVNPLAVRALSEVRIDASGLRSKGLDEIPRHLIDTVITLCAEEVCPAWLGNARRVHWGLPDPAAVEGPEQRRFAAFQAVRDELGRRLRRMFGGSAEPRA